MHTIMPDDTRTQDLLQRAKSGDADVFAELFESLRPQLLRIIHGKLSPTIRQRVDPEDVLQDTFVRASHSVERFEWQGDGSFHRWIEAIAAHVVLDVVRWQRRRAALRLDREPVGDGAPPSQGLRRKERRERLDLALASLSPDYRTVLQLSRMDGLTMRQIGVRMKRSENAVKILLFRATRKLKEAFGDTVSLGLASRPHDETGATDDQ